MTFSPRSSFPLPESGDHFPFSISILFYFVLFYFSLRSTTLVTNSRKGAVSLRLLPLPCLISHPRNVGSNRTVVYSRLYFFPPFLPSLFLLSLPSLKTTRRRIPRLPYNCARDKQLCFAPKGHSAIVSHISSSYQSTHNTRTRTSRTRSS